MVIRVNSTGKKQETGETSFSPATFGSFDRLFEDFISQWANRGRTPARAGEAWHPTVDVYEKERDLVIQADLPGVDEKDIDLKIEGNVLTIAGEKRLNGEASKAIYYQMECAYGRMSRSFRLPDSVNHDKISASYKNGVLTVTIPYKPEAASRSIKIND